MPWTEKKTKVEHHIGVHAPGVDDNRVRRERVVCDFFRSVSITIAASRSRRRNRDRLVSPGTDTAFLQKVSAPKVHAEFSAVSTIRTEKLSIAEGGDFFSLHHLLTMVKTLFFPRPHGDGCRYCNTSYHSGGNICIFERNVLRGGFFFLVCV